MESPTYASTVHTMVSLSVDPWKGPPVRLTCVPGMASSPKVRYANGMSGKVGSSAHGHNGAPVKGTHKAESIDHPGTNGTRVNGATTNGANGH